MSATPERNMARLAVIAKVLTAPFVRFELHGQDYVAETHVAIIAANHRSFFDVPAGLIALHHFKRYPRLLVASTYFERRATRRFVRSIGAIPVDRERKSGTAASAAVEALREGVPILVMPEGRLHWDPSHPLATGPVRPGVSRLAVAADVPVVPVAISGTETVWPASKRLPRFNPFRRKTVVIRLSGSLLHFENDDHEANTGEVMANIRALLAVSAGVPPEGV